MGVLIRNNAVGTLSGIEVKDCDIHDVVGELTDYRDGKESGGIVFYINVDTLSSRPSGTTSASRTTRFAMSRAMASLCNRSGSTSRMTRIQAEGPWRLHSFH